jgi:hypothetical protein
LQRTVLGTLQSLNPLCIIPSHTPHITRITLYTYIKHHNHTQRETDPYIKVHIGATSLHYGQACFEGLKAFHCKDGKVRIFRPDQNALRICSCPP